MFPSKADSPTQHKVSPVSPQVLPKTYPEAKQAHATWSETFCMHVMSIPVAASSAAGLGVNLLLLYANTVIDLCSLFARRVTADRSLQGDEACLALSGIYQEQTW